MLTGRKVTLRAVEREDLPWIWELRNDADSEALAYGAPTPRSRAEVEQRFDRNLTDAAVESFVIEAGGEMVGRCDVFDIDLEDRNARIGMTVASEHRGKGYGSDTVRVLLDYCFRRRNLHKVCLDVLASNEPAMRTYLACGFVEEGRLRSHSWHEGRYEDLIVMAVLLDEWQPRSGKP